MDRELIAELDAAIRKTITGMKKVEIFDSHAILNNLYFARRDLYDRLIEAFSPSNAAQWVAFRRNVYNRIEASSGDLISKVEGKQSWSVLYSGDSGPCTFWRKLSKAERDAALAKAMKIAAKAKPPKMVQPQSRKEAKKSTQK